MGFPQSKQVGHLHVQQAYALNEIFKEEHWSREEPESRAAPCWNPGGVMLNCNRLAQGTVNVSWCPITITLLQHCELSPPSGCLFKAKNLQPDGNCNQVSYGVPLYALNSGYISLDVCGRNRSISFELFCKLVIEYPVCFPWEKAFPFSQMYMHI